MSPSSRITTPTTAARDYRPGTLLVKRGETWPVDMTDRRAPGQRPRDTGETGRERVSRAAYELFSREGLRAVGVDAVIARAGTAKMTLYRNFPSKDDLIIDFLRRREQLWTREWLEAENNRA